MWKPTLALLLGFLVGLTLAVIMPLGYKKVKLYPTPANVGTMVYQDSAGVCYKPKSEVVQCTSNARPIPPQS